MSTDRTHQAHETHQAHDEYELLPYHEAARVAHVANPVLRLEGVGVTAVQRSGRVHPRFTHSLRCSHPPSVASTTATTPVVAARHRPETLGGRSDSTPKDPT